MLATIERAMTSEVYGHLDLNDMRAGVEAVLQAPRAAPWLEVVPSGSTTRPRAAF